MPTLALLQSVFDSSPNAYRVVDRELRYVLVNKVYGDLTASEPAHLIGRPMFEVFPDDPNDPRNARLNLIKRSIERVFENGRTDVVAAFNYKAPRKTPTGPRLEERVFSATHTPIVDEEGVVTHVLGHLVELTELEEDGAGNTAVQSKVLDRARQAAEAANMLRLEAEQLRNLFEQAPGFIAVLRGPEHTYVLANPGQVALTGRKDLIGKTVRQVTPEVEGQGFFDILDRVYTTGKPYIGREMPVRLERTAGHMEERVIDFVYQPIIEDDQVVGILVMGSDVTDARSAASERDRLALERAALIRREEIALAALESVNLERQFLADFVPAQVWTANNEGQLTHVNRQVVEYFQKPPVDLLGAKWLSLVHADDREVAATKWAASLTSGEPYEVQFRLLNGLERTYRWHLARAVPLRDMNGSIVKWFGTNLDVDEMKAGQVSLEHLVRQLEDKNRELDRFAYVASHDLKAPLRAISNISSFIEEDLGTAAPQSVKDNLLALAGRARRMQQLIDGVLAYSRSLEGQDTLEIVAPAVSARDALAMLEVPAGVEVEIVEPMPTVRTSRQGLSQIFLHLLGNALKHVNAPGGHVTVRATTEATGIRIDVIDDGPGIARQHHQRVWELFQTLNRDPEASTGIGLSIVRRIVEAQGGTVGIDSAEGHGARFFFTLPRALVSL